MVTFSRQPLYLDTDDGLFLCISPLGHKRIRIAGKRLVAPFKSCYDISTRTRTKLAGPALPIVANFALSVRNPFFSLRCQRRVRRL